MKTLHLNLIRKWFDMIKSGKKQHEYRDVTTYWCSRLLLFDGKHRKPEYWQGTFDTIQCGKRYYLTNSAIKLLESLIVTGLVKYKTYQIITFSNGMTPPVPRFNVEIKNIWIGTGLKEWGADPDLKYFVFNLKGELD